MAVVEPAKERKALIPPDKVVEIARQFASDMLIDTEDCDTEYLQGYRLGIKQVLALLDIEGMEE